MKAADEQEPAEQQPAGPHPRGAPHRQPIRALSIKGPLGLYRLQPSTVHFDSGARARGAVCRPGHELPAACRGRAPREPRIRAKLSAPRAQRGARASPRVYTEPWRCPLPAAVQAAGTHAACAGACRQDVAGAPGGPRSPVARHARNPPVPRRIVGCRGISGGCRAGLRVRLGFCRLFNYEMYIGSVGWADGIDVSLGGDFSTLLDGECKVCGWWVTKLLDSIARVLEKKASLRACGYQ